MPTTTTATCEPDIDGDWRITVTHRREPGWLGRLFGQRPSVQTETFVGRGGTVWYRYPNFQIVDAETNLFLHSICRRSRYERANRAKAAKGGSNA